MAGAKKTPSKPGALLTNLDQEIQASRAEIEDRERYLKGLEAARKCLADQVLSNAFKTPRTHRRRKSTSFNGGGSRMQMLRTLLASLAEPVTVDEIMEEMKRHGVQDDKTNVRSSLSALKRAGEAKNPERGRWIGVTTRVAA